LPWPAPTKVSREAVPLEGTARPTATLELTAELEEGRRRGRKRARIGLVIAAVVVVLSLAGLWWGPHVWHGGLRAHPNEVPAKSVDQLALDRVVAGLRDAHLAGAEKIRPTVGDGIVHLEGEAPNTAAVDGAAEIAARVTGYVVDKNVRIVSPAAPPISSPAMNAENKPVPLPSAEPPTQQNLVASPTTPRTEPTVVPGGDSSDVKTPSSRKPVDPRIPPLLASAREKYENGQLDEAIGDYDAVLSIDRHNREAQRGRAKVISARDYVKKQGLAADQ
jgi:hypothetical protein